MKKLQINVSVIDYETPNVKNCILGLTGNDSTNVIKKFIYAQHTYDKNEFIYLSTQRNAYLYVLASGCCKECFINTEGEEIVNDFYYPGDVIGLENLYIEKLPLSVSALQFTRLYAMPLRTVKVNLQQLATWLLEHHVLQHNAKALLSHRTAAQERIAAFFMKHILSQNELAPPIKLPMTLLDVGHYIGLAPETICRHLRALKSKGVLTLSGKHEIMQYDLEALKRLSSSTSALL